MSGVNLDLLTLAFPLCLTIKPQRPSSSDRQTIPGKTLATDDATNTPELRSLTAVDAETLAHSLLVLFLVAPGHLPQMHLATGVTKIRFFSTTSGGAKAGIFASPVGENVFLGPLHTRRTGAVAILRSQCRLSMSRRHRAPNCFRNQHSSFTQFDYATCSFSLPRSIPYRPDHCLAAAARIPLPGDC